MQTRAAIIGLIGIAVVAGGVYAMGNKPKTEAEAIAASDTQGDALTPPEAPAVALGVPGACPSAANSVALMFKDELTDKAQQVITSYDESTRDEKMREPEAIRKIQYLDLNNDGNEDFAALYTGANWCGSLGCQVEVFVNNGDGNYTGSAAFYGAEGTAFILESTKNGMRQAITPVQSGGLPSERFLWTWNGEKYESKRHCLQTD